MKNIHLKLRPILQRDREILRRRLRMLGLLKDFLKKDSKSLDMLMIGYDANVCKKLEEYRKLDRRIFEELRQMLISRGLNSAIAGQVVLTWGKAIIGTVSSDLEEDTVHRWESERYSTAEKRSGSRRSVETKKEDSSPGFVDVLIKGGEEIIKGIAREKLKEIRNEDFRNDSWWERSEVDSRNADPIIVRGRQPPEVIHRDQKLVRQSSSSRARERDLEWLFDYAIKDVIPKSVFFDVSVSKLETFSGGIGSSNESFRNADFFYHIARGKLDILQGKNTSNAAIAAGIYLRQNTLGSQISPIDMDERSRASFVKRAKERLEFDKPRGFMPPTDGEMKEYARNLVQNMAEMKSSVVRRPLSRDSLF